ncbi:unnamed protein product [Arabidopsis halleri]
MRDLMMKIYTIMFILLVVRTSSFKPFRGCSRTKGYEDLVYCAPSLRKNSQFNFPIPECCKNLKIDKMYCLCDAVNPNFLEVFDVEKLPKLSHACGDLLVPGSYCGCYEDLIYCVTSLRLDSPFIPPIPECCKNLKIDKMYCLCDAVNPTFGERFDVKKLGKLSHACGDLLAPGSYCGGK